MPLVARTRLVSIASPSCVLTVSDLSQPPHGLGPRHPVRLELADSVSSISDVSLTVSDVIDTGSAAVLTSERS